MTPLAASDKEMRSMKKAIEEGRMEKMKSGGSVMARGGRMGRSKPTKMY